MDFVKYPKTYAIDRELSPKDLLSNVLDSGQMIVVEEKMDGTQLGFQFTINGTPILQSRGTIISNEPEFGVMKSWLWKHQATLFEAMGTRYILFGEWLWAKHSIFYDKLPHYFLEFDIYDRQKNTFMSTAARQTFLKIHEIDFVHSVRVIPGKPKTLSDLKKLIETSAFIGKNAYEKLSAQERSHTDITQKMEGLYIKIEDEEQVIKRYKLIRPEFLEMIITSGEHWKKRQTIQNQIHYDKSDDH